MKPPQRKGRKRQIAAEGEEPRQEEKERERKYGE